MYSTKNHNLIPRSFSGLVEEMFNGGWNGLLTADTKDRMNVPVNIRETDTAYELQVVAPGLKKEDFKINRARNILSVSCEQKE